MACNEHWCRDCSHIWFDNSMGHTCPMCGSGNSTFSCDERDDDDALALADESYDEDLEPDEI